MEIVSRYSEVLDAKGDPVDISTFLPLARAAVQESLAVEIDHHPLETFDARTRFACVRQHYVAVNPLEAVKPPRKEAPKDNVDAVLVEGRTVMNAVQSGDDPDEARWLLAFLGLRRGERLGRRTRHTRTHPRQRLNSSPHTPMSLPVRATLTTQTASSPDRTRPSGSATAPRCGPNRVPGRSRRG